MARPASRYFVPVIRKISEMKKAENIRIDQQFKADLRGQLMIRAGLGEAGVKDSIREDGVETTNGFMGFLRKWKFQMALAPVAFLLVFVAVQSLKMPVKMESETVVPVAGNTQSADVGKVAETAQTAVETQVIGDVAAVGEVPQDVGAAANAPVADEPALFTIPVELQNIADTEVTNEDVNAGALPEPVAPDSGLAGGESAEPAKVSRTVQGVPTVAERAVTDLQIVSQPVLYKVPVVKTPVAGVTGGNAPGVGGSATGLAKKPGVAAGDVPAELLEQSVNSGVSASDVNTGHGEAEPVVELPQQLDAAQIVVPTSKVEIEQIAPKVNLMEIYTPKYELIETPEQSAAEVYYDFSFGGDKESLENDLLKNLMKDGGYTYASVSEADDGVVMIELSAGDGSLTKKMFRQNARTHAWDEVVYVQNYYFDEGLQYERVNLSSPSYVPPFGDGFHDPYYYRDGN